MRRQQTVLLALVLFCGAVLGGHKSKRDKAVDHQMRNFGAFDDPKVDRAVESLLVEHDLMQRPEGGCDAAGDSCANCAHAIGCMWTEYACKEADDKYLSADLSKVFYSQTLVDSTKHLLLVKAYQDGHDEKELAGMINSAQSDILATLRTIMSGEFIADLKKQLFDSQSISGLACNGNGWIAPGMIVPSENTKAGAAKYRIEKFVAAGKMKLIYLGTILKDDGTPHEIDGTSQCVIKVNQKKPDPTDPIVMGDVRREAVAQRILNSPGVEDERRYLVEALYDETTFRGTPVIISEYGILGRVADLTKAPEGWQSVDGLRQILIKWLLGVEYMSDKGFIHHDLHSQNAMFAEGPDGRPTIKLIDFGATTYSRIKAVDDEFEDGRFRIDAYGQASNAFAPFWQDNMRYYKSLVGHAVDSLTMFLCTYAKIVFQSATYHCPDTIPDDVAIERKIPDNIYLRSKVELLLTFAYMDSEFQETVASGKYCSEDEECLHKHSAVRNTFDTVNVINEYLGLLFCSSEVQCKMASYDAEMPLAADIPELKREAGDDFALFQQKVAEKAAWYGEHLNDDDKTMKLLLAKRKFLFQQYALDFVCPKSISPDELPLAYEAIGVDFPDNGKHTSASIIQAYKAFFFNDATVDLSGQADLMAVLDNRNFQDFLVRALDCNAHDRADARELLEHPFLAAKAAHADHNVVTGSLQGGTAGSTLVELAGTDPLVDEVLGSTKTLSINTMTNGDWEWANAATINTNRIREAPYVTPRRRIEIDLKTGDFFIKGFDLSAYKTPQEFIKKLFDPEAGSLPKLNIMGENCMRYLWAVTVDWRLIIAPESNVAPEDGKMGQCVDRVGETFTTPDDSQTYAGSEWNVHSRVLKHGDLTPGQLIKEEVRKGAIRRKTKVMVVDPSEDSEDKFMTPSGHNNADDDDSGLSGEYTRACIYTQEEMLDSHPPNQENALADVLKLPAYIADSTMFTTSELGQELWGQCRAPQRMAGELYFTRIDEGFSGTQTGPLMMKRWSIEPTKWNTHEQRPVQKTMRWVIDPESSASFQRNPDMLTGRRSTEDVGVHRIRILLDMLKAMGVDVDHVWTNAATQDGKAVARFPVKPTDDGGRIELVAPDPNRPTEVCILHNTSHRLRMYKLKCRNPKSGIRAPKYVEYAGVIGKVGTARLGADACRQGTADMCEIVEDNRA